MLFNLPNILTLMRIVTIPLIVGLFYLSDPLARWSVCFLFVFAAITDFLDGYMARRQNLVSSLGRFLDPIADKLLVGASLLMLCAFGESPFGGLSGISVLPAVVIMLREILVSGLREFLAELHVPVPVSRLAKWKTGFQMTAIPYLLVGNAAPKWIPAHFLGVMGLWIAAILTLITGWDYLRAGLKHMANDQEH
jgi:cardiolipin synthase